MSRGIEHLVVAVRDLEGPPQSVFFTCAHRHAPEHFYKPAYQAHANGASRVSRVVIDSPDVEATSDFLSVLGVDKGLFDIRPGGLTLLRR